MLKSKGIKYILTPTGVKQKKVYTHPDNNREFIFYEGLYYYVNKNKNKITTRSVTV